MVIVHAVLIDFNRFFFVKRIEKVKTRVKSEFETTIKVSDSKNVEVVFVMKEVESAVKNIGVKQREFQQMLAKQKRVRNLIFFFRREDDLINQEIRTIRALDELDFFSIDDDEAELFEGSAEMFLIRFRS